ncbi:MAG: GNAT family N-acetyltransferase [Oscillospiraceae bacterium]|nr:GNAT family N-acetyltransferase [Oscillospiraceae bacterium]
MEVYIREIEEKDYLALLSIMNSEIGSRYATVAEIAPHYYRVKDDERYKTFMALIEDEVVGFASTVQFYTVGLDGNLIWLVQMAVKREMQNKGIGSKLLRHIEAYAREKGCDSIILNSGVRRIDAHAFYKRNGYNTDSNSWCFSKTL